jgi:hypothetical protein
MKRYMTILLSLVLCACAGYPYPVQDAGDGVYYAASPPDYQYVSGYGSYNYFYTPYYYPYYFSLWSSPLIEAHYYGWRGPMRYPYWPSYRHYQTPVTSFAGDQGPVNLENLYRAYTPPLRQPASVRVLDQQGGMKADWRDTMRPAVSNQRQFMRNQSPKNSRNNPARTSPSFGSANQGQVSRPRPARATPARSRPSPPASAAPRRTHKQ